MSRLTFSAHTAFVQAEIAVLFTLSPPLPSHSLVDPR